MNISWSLAILAMLLAVLNGCGGGGGGSGEVPEETSPIYDGNPNAADITATNAAGITANVLGSGSAPGSVASASVVGSLVQNSSGGVAHLPRLLNRSVRNTFSQAQQASAGAQLITAAIPIDQIDPCDSGSVRLVGTLSDDGTGTLTVFYNDCRFGDETLSGQATLQIDAMDLSFFVPTDSTLSFRRLKLRGPGISSDAGGKSHTETSLGTNTDTITSNIVTEDHITGRKRKTEDLVFVDVYDNYFFPSSLTETINGRTFHSVHGYVDVSTSTALSFGSLSQLFPGSGQMQFMGSPGPSIRATALSATLLKLELDLDGNSVIDNTATLKWTDLTGPVGADLGDSDGDGMHNGWEAANGLNPFSAADAALDNDSDTFSNLAEYQAGTDPNNAGSIPPIAGLAIALADFPDPVSQGSSLTYTINVSNSSSTAAANVVVTDALPGSVNLNSVTPSQGNCAGTTTVICNLGTVNGFGFASITIVITPTVAGLLSNSVSVTSSTFDPDLTDNNAAVTTTVLETITATVVDLPGVSDLIYDAGAQLVYASVLGNPGSIVPITPLTAAVGTAISVGHDPIKLARSDDGQFLYVGLDGTNDVQRINLATQAVNLTFSLGNASLGPIFAEDMEVFPGAPQSVAVSRRYKGFSPRHTGVAIYDDGVPRINTTQVHTGSNVIEFSASAGTLYGYNNETTEFGFRRLAVNASGVTEVDVFTSFDGDLIAGFGVDIKFHAGLIYTTTGRVIDPVTRMVVGTFSLPSAFGTLVIADAAIGRVFFLTQDSGTWILRAFDITTRQPLGGAVVQGMTGTPGSLVRWGAKGLAFRTSAGKIFLIESTTLIP